MKKGIAFVLIALMLVFMALSSCTPGPNNLKNTETETGKVAGFLRGIWHGIITPFAFVISLFSKNVNIYEVHNNGGWYNFGFVIGLSIIFGGSGGATRCGRRRE